MIKIEDLTVVILVGGSGTRLRSKVVDRPKVLAEVYGRPFLAYLLDQVVDSGARNIVLCTGYLGDQVHTVFGDTYKSLQLAYSQEAEPLGTAGALRLALPMFQSDPILILNGDSFCDVDFSAFLTWCATNCFEAAMVLTKVFDTSRYGQVEIRNNDSIFRFIEKNEGIRNPGWINAGIYLLSQKFIRTIPQDRIVSLEYEIFPTMVGQDLHGFKHEGKFLDIGTPESYASADQFFSGESHL